VEKTLGSDCFLIDGQIVQRIDFQVVWPTLWWKHLFASSVFAYLGHWRTSESCIVQLENKRGQVLECSHYLPIGESKYPCVIYCHGNSGFRKYIKASSNFLARECVLQCADNAWCKLDHAMLRWRCRRLRQFASSTKNQRVFFRFLGGWNIGRRHLYFGEYRHTSHVFWMKHTSTHGSLRGCSNHESHYQLDVLQLILQLIMHNHELELDLTWFML
jgi:hypothetical protein